MQLEECMKQVEREVIGKVGSDIKQRMTDHHVTGTQVWLGIGKLILS